MATKNPLKLESIDTEEQFDAARRAASTRTPKELVDKAWRAHREGQALLPGLTSIARAVSGNPNMKVRFAPGTPCTKDDWINLRVPLELGDLPDHNRNLCEKYDELELSCCPRCRVVEKITATLAHEVAHHTEGTFSALDEQHKIELVQRAVAERAGSTDAEVRVDFEKALEEAGHLAGLDAQRRTEVIDGVLAASGYTPQNLRAAKIEKLINEYVENKTRRGESIKLMEAANLASPYLGFLVNGLEDARVNAGAIKARPGLRRQFRAQILQVMREGVEGDDGEKHKWSEAPLDRQAVIALYLAAAGHRDQVTAENFDQRVVDAVLSPSMRGVLRRFEAIRSPSGVYELAFPVLEELRKSGLCVRRDDPMDDIPPTKMPPGMPPPPGMPSLGSNGGGDDDDDAGEQAGASGDSEKDADEGQDGEDKGQGAGDADADDADDAGDADEGSGAGDADADDADEGSGAGDADDADEGSGAGDDDADEGSGAGDDDADEGSVADDDDADEDEDEDDLEDFEEQLQELFGHGEFVQSDPEENASDMATGQAAWFSGPSSQVAGVRVHRQDKPIPGLTPSLISWESPTSDPTPSEALISGSLQAARRVFAENAAGKTRTGQRVGRVNGRDLARVPTGYQKPFMNRSLPGKQDWFVVIGMDVSGSTGAIGGYEMDADGYRRPFAVVEVLKKAVRAQADLLARTGVSFAIYAHTEEYAQVGYGTYVDLIEIKSPDEPWGSKQKTRLAALQACSGNLDGHTLEQYRRIAQEQPAKDKVILYYTDGAMPASNAVEEAEILRRESALILKDPSMHLLGVGYRVDSPKQYGMETTVIHGPEDLPLVVEALRKVITGS